MPLRPSKLLLGNLAILALTLGAAAPAHTAVAQGQDSRDSVAWPWRYRDHGTFVLTLVFAPDSTLLRGYVVAAGQPPCDSARARLPDSTFLRRAGQFLAGVGWEFWHPGQQEVRRRSADFVEVAPYAGDFGAQVVFHKQGALVFAGTWVWSGAGTQLWPPVDLNISPLPMRGELAPSFTDLAGPLAAEHALLRKVRALTAVAALAQRGPYHATVFGWQPSAPFGPVLPIVLVTSDGKTGVCPGK